MNFDFPVDYQALFRALPENFLLIGPDAAATIVDNTDRHVAVSLKPRVEVVGKPFFDAFPATNDASAAVIRESHEHVRQHLAPHTMPVIRYDLAGPDGALEEFYWQATHYPVLDAAGGLQFILQRTQNITEQHRAAERAAQVQRALDEEQQRTRFILDALPVLVWTNRPDGTPDYYNPRWEAFTGLPAAAGFDWEASAGLVHADDAPRLAREWAEAVAAGREYQIEFRLRRHDGHYRWILARNVPRRDEAGRVTMWVGCGTDIHDQKQLVQELLTANEQQAALADQAYQNAQQAEQQRRILFDMFTHAPAMISVVRGPEHRYEFANEEFLKLVGRTSVVGRTVAEVFPEIMNQGIVQQLDEVYRTGQPATGQELRVQLDRGDGQLRDGYFNFSYQRFEENGQPAGITAYSYDVTELVHARQALAKLAPRA